MNALWLGLGAVVGLGVLAGLGFVLWVVAHPEWQKKQLNAPVRTRPLTADHYFKQYWNSRRSA